MGREYLAKVPPKGLSPDEQHNEQDERQDASHAGSREPGALAPAGERSDAKHDALHSLSVEAMARAGSQRQT